MRRMCWRSTGVPGDWYSENCFGGHIRCDNQWRGPRQRVDLDLRKLMIVHDGQPISSNIDRCYLEGAGADQTCEITFKDGESYFYNKSNLKFLYNPEKRDPRLYEITAPVSRNETRTLYGIKEIHVFKSGQARYWHICFDNGTSRDWDEGKLRIKELPPPLTAEPKTRKVFDYLQTIASRISLRTEDGTSILRQHYSKAEQTRSDRAMATYLNPARHPVESRPPSFPIFPFGFNESQFEAVRNALDNSLSVIEGPPGTGKTQTILNIIANLLVDGKTVQVVSYNNSATLNVRDKLSSDKYGMGFLVAPLGSNDNKKQFCLAQTGKYPDLTSWEMDDYDLDTFEKEIPGRIKKLQKVFAKRREAALKKQELRDLDAEMKHFEAYMKDLGVDAEYKVRKDPAPDRLLSFLRKLEDLAEMEKPLPLLLRLKGRFVYGIGDWALYRRPLGAISVVYEHRLYHARRSRLDSGIKALETDLKALDADNLAKDFERESLDYLKGVLFRKYGDRKSRQQFDEADMRGNPKKFQEEYPVVLSSTYSSVSSLGGNACFDYLIMDEASQTDVATGALALSSAKNAVIVGDLKQLPNVLSEDDKALARKIFESCEIDPAYDYASNSFLKSVCDVVRNCPRVLLKEHYRCHPLIIGFCNEKFYNNQLVVMTDDKDGADALHLDVAGPGQHRRGFVNQRQIDMVTDEILPRIKFNSKDVGIIAPYNGQVDSMKRCVPDPLIEIATVHKFQGREKDAIILTTVDDQVNEFSDNPYLLNVAVSRAKKQFNLVVSSSDQGAESNIADLISYIRYHEGIETQSKIRSVFDYLGAQYEESRKACLDRHPRISEFDSENLMYGQILDTLKKMGLDSFGVVCHQSLRPLLRDTKALLTSDEQRYADNPATHLDFLIYNKVGKVPVLAIEVDGVRYHKAGTRQAERDKMKNDILKRYSIPCARFRTDGSGESERLEGKLNRILAKGIPL